MANNLTAVKNINSELDVTVSKLNTVQSSILKISETARKSVGDFGGISLPQDAEANTKAYENAIKKLNFELDNQRKETLKLAEQVARLQQTRTRATKKGIEQRVAETALRKELRNQVRSVIDLGNAYDNLAAQNNRLIRERQDLAIRQKTNNDLTDQEIARLTELTNTIKANQRVLSETDQEIGNFRRNVGNYASAYDGLGNSVAQVSRELPAFAISAQTGFLAISNNIPILADEINRLIATNKQLVAQGKPVQNVFKRIGGAILSFNSLMSVAITLIVVYGKEIGAWVEELLKGDDALEEAAKSQEAFNKAQEEGSKAAASEITTLEALFEITRDVTESQEDRIKAADKIIELSNGQITVQQRLNLLEEDSINIQNRLIKSIANRQIATALLSSNDERNQKIASNLIEIDERRLRIIDLTNRQLVLEDNLQKASAISIDAVTKAKNQLQETTTVLVNEQQKEDELVEENTKLREKNNEVIQTARNLSDDFIDSLVESNNATSASNSILSDRFALEEFRLQQLIEINQNILDNDENTALQRTNAAIQLQKDQLKLSEAQRDFDIKLLKESLKNREVTLEQFKLREELINEKFADRNSEIQQEAQDNNIKIFEDGFKKRLDIIEDFTTKSERDFQNELSTLQDILRKRGALEEEIEEQTRDKISELRISQLKDLIDLTTKELKAIAITAEQREILEDRLSKLRAKLSDEQLEKFLTDEARRREIIEQSISGISTALNDAFGVDARVTQRFFDTLITNFDQVGKKGKATFEDIAEVAGATFDFLGEISNALFEGNINRLEEQLTANTEYYEGILNNEELTDEQRTALEEQRDAKEKVLQEKRNQELTKQARAKKAFDAAEVIANTAVGVSKALAQGGFLFGVPFSTVVAALGAVQLATVLAQPIPQFAEGGEMTHDGLMMINDHPSGRTELVERKGKLYKTDKKNAVVHGKKGDIIHPDANEYLSNYSDSQIVNDLQRHIVMSNITHQNYLSDKHDMASKLINSNDQSANKIIKAINNQSRPIYLNQKIDIAKDLRFLNRKNDIL